MKLRDRLLRDLSDRRPFKPPPVSASTVRLANAWGEMSPSEILADVNRALEEAPKLRRGAGSSYRGMPIEIDPHMPEGWFGLRESGKPRYAGPLPLSSIGIFYREGDFVCVGPDTMRRLIQKAAANSLDAALPSPPDPS